MTNIEEIIYSKEKAIRIINATINSNRNISNNISYIDEYKINILLDKITIIKNEIIDIYDILILIKTEHCTSINDINRVSTIGINDIFNVQSDKLLLAQQLKKLSKHDLTELFTMYRNTGTVILNTFSQLSKEIKELHKMKDIEKSNKVETVDSQIIEI
jgi:hypothetical protein